MKLNNRCCICDYTQETGSSLTGQAPSHAIVVKYSNRFRGFYCSGCLHSIGQNLYELKYDQEAKTHERDVPIIDAFTLPGSDQL
jgi:hypothetical protein